MKYSETTLRVRYKDTDQMGVVYYANYFIWFEVGRSEFFRSLGMSYKYLEQNGILLPVIETYCSYKYPARYDELLKIVTRLHSLEVVKLGFQYEIMNVETEKLLARGETTHAFVNKQGKPVVLRKQNPFLWRLIKDKLQVKKEI
ncbi:MAG: acyl-CoA thioesterase [Firmicutes bacterium]|jgi:acyl-CoA thioester hydrolase|nr:acyl-CoA thioesterase [Bacillota bacterium]